MPNGPTHLLLGLGSALAAHYLIHSYLPLDPLSGVLALGCAALGSIAPDIDHPTGSTARNVAGLQRGAGPLGCLGLVGNVLSRALGGHRGFTHSLLCCALLTLAGWQLLPSTWWPFAIAFGVGYTSHILADLPGGVRLWWPL